jgi:hypothetical protein
MEFPKTLIEHPDPKAQHIRVVFLVLSYYNSAEDLKKKITDLIRASFPDVDFRLMFKSHYTLGRYFNHKVKTQKVIKSKIVYRLNCLDCEKFYVGQSINHVCKRKEEHMGDQDSSVYKHARIRHRIDWDNMKILDTARDQRRLLLKEMLDINKLTQDQHIN